MAKDKKEKIILAADVGGTKTFIGTFAVGEGLIKALRVERFVNADFSSIEEVVQAFLEDEAGTIDAASFGVASPVLENRARLTNIDWVIDGPALAERFGIKRLELINDLVATGWGVGGLSGGELDTINRGVKREGNAALIAAGTGLGEAVLYWDGKSHRPSSSEGGHSDFAPRSEVEIELLRYLMKKFGHVSYERVLSGMGLVNIFSFFMEREGKELGADLKRRFDAEGAAKVISDEAVNGGESAAASALELFLKIYGAEAANLALKSMSIGGLYIGGGIAPKIFKEREKEMFMKSFLDKGRFGELLSGMPVHLIMKESTALYGAARYAAGLVSGGGGRGGAEMVKGLDAGG
ncbi:MAG: glucokinase [Thermodesulfobacteriota bacterium]